MVEKPAHVSGFTGPRIPETSDVVFKIKSNSFWILRSCKYHYLQCSQTIFGAIDLTDVRTKTKSLPGNAPSLGHYQQARKARDVIIVGEIESNYTCKSFRQCYSDGRDSDIPTDA